MKVLCCIFGVALVGLWILFTTTTSDKCFVGLLLNLIGVVITSFFTFQQSDKGGYCLELEEGTVIDDKGTTVKEAKGKDQQQKKWHKRWAVLGLCYLLSGLAFQLWHQWIANTK